MNTVYDHAIRVKRSIRLAAWLFYVNLLTVATSGDFQGCLKER
jgi:hypothetical protein